MWTTAPTPVYKKLSGWVGRPRVSQFLTRKEQVVLLILAGSIALGGAALFYHQVYGPVEVVAPVPQTPLPLQDLPEAKQLEPSPPISPLPSPQVPSTTSQPTPGEERDSITVAVLGAVVRPAVYKFRAGTRVQDAIDRAGGLAESADLGDLNLAAPLIDGTTLRIPTGTTARIVGGKLMGRGGDMSGAVNPPEYTLSGWRPSPPPETASAGVGPSQPAPASGLIDLNRASAEELESLPSIGPALAARIIEYREQHPFRTVDDLDQVKGIGPKTLEAVRPFVIVR